MTEAEEVPDLEGVIVRITSLSTPARFSTLVFCLALALCSSAAALDLGVSIGRDGTTLATEDLGSQPLGAMATCDLRSGEHFVLRLKAGYGTALSRQYGVSPLSETYDHKGLYVVRVQAAPCVEVGLPPVPAYVRAGMGCGFHTVWTMTNSTDFGEGSLAYGRANGLDVSALLTLGLRASPRLALELTTERLLADWSLTARRGYAWDPSEAAYIEGSNSSGWSLNWKSILDPGYAVGFVLAL